MQMTTSHHLLGCDVCSDGNWHNLEKMKCWIRTVLPILLMFWGMISVFCYNMLICICYITLLYVLINKFTTGYSEDVYHKPYM